MKLILCISALCFVLVGCGDSSEDKSSDTAVEVFDAAETSSDTVDAATLSDASDSESLDADLVFDALVFDVSRDVNEDTD